MTTNMNPEHLSLEGMVRQANEILDQPLDSNNKGIPKRLVKHCKGIVVVRKLVSGLGITGTDGVGVIVARREDGTWSLPSAVGILGLGVGAVGGVERRDVIVIITSDGMMKAISGEGQAKLGVSGGVSVGPVGREADVAADVSGKGAGAAFSYAHSKGLFGGVAIGGDVIRSLDKENHKAYKKDVTPEDILFGEAGALETPKDSGIEELHEKLGMLTEGKTK